MKLPITSAFLAGILVARQYCDCTKCKEWRTNMKELSDKRDSESGN